MPFKVEKATSEKIIFYCLVDSNLKTDGQSQKSTKNWTSPCNDNVNDDDDDNENDNDDDDYENDDD